MCIYTSTNLPTENYVYIYLRKSTLTPYYVGKWILRKTTLSRTTSKKRQEKLTATRQTCPHCSKIVDPMNFARWHGDKCKVRI